MVSHDYIWLTWSGVFLLAFLIVYLRFPGRRSTMLLAGVLTALFGLTEPLFVPEYRNPLSLFDLAQRTGFDIESLIFNFAIGGIAVTMYNELTRRGPHPVPAEARSLRRLRMHMFSLLAPYFALVLLSPFRWNPIYSVTLALLVGAATAILSRPDLVGKMLAGGLLFLGYYALFMLALVITAPGYIERVWNLPALSGILVLGIPLEELLFGFAFGLFWSSVHEHLKWSRAFDACRATTADREPKLR